MNRPSDERSPGTDTWWGMLRSAVKRSVWERPAFSGSWVIEGRPGRPLDSRENRFVRTELISMHGGERRLYHIAPSEYYMDRKRIEAVTRTISEMAEHPPPPGLMDDQEGLQSYMERSCSRLISRTCDLDPEEDVPLLARLCAQYSSGFGVLEHLLRDERVQDIYIDPPPGITPVYVSLGGMGDPELEGTYPTNIILSVKELERIVSLLRYSSGRPFSESTPVLECDMPLHKARATVVSPPMSQNGLSMALRKHSHDPWTLLRLVSVRALSPCMAGFLGLCIEGRSTMLIAGSRGAGKSSLLGGLLFEVDRAQRIIVIEDTPELPVNQLLEHGYKVLGLTVGQGKASTPESALRTALRLGESVLVMGEVRGPETRVLYEAMSAGTAGSSVMGTFHADSAKAVYKRVVDDMGVPPGSFSATDLVIVSGLVRPKGRKARLRRVMQVSELVKKGRPGRFRDLFSYDPGKDLAEPTDTLPTSQVLKRTGRMWGMSQEEMLSELSLRTRIFEEALSFLGGEAVKPGSAVRTSEAFREARENAARGGWLDDHGRTISEWRSRMEGDDR